MTQTYHILLSVPFDLHSFDVRARAGQNPRHILSGLRDALLAEVHVPGTVPITMGDKFHSKAPGVGTKETWALARDLAPRLSSNDVVFCIGEDTGFPLAAQLLDSKVRPKLAIFVHNAHRPRVRYMFWRHKLVEKIDQFITNTEYKAQILKDKMGVPSDRVFNIPEQTDTRFFTPGDQSPSKTRLLIGSGGLEARDYVTLAKATADMDADVRICAVSPNAKRLGDTFPKILPKNMKVDFYDWQDLRQLYRDSDVVVISLKNHSYQAGLTTLFEALACRRPVVMTHTTGLVQSFAEKGFLTSVPPNDFFAMRAAIENLLENREAAKMQSDRGHQAVVRSHNYERFVADLVDQVRKC